MIGQKYVASLIKEETVRLAWVQAHPTHQHENKGPLHRDRLAWLRGRIRELGGERWLVAGCGGGYLEAGWPLPWAPAPVDLVEGLLKPGGICANLLNLPFRDGVFHGVVASEVLEHLRDPAPALDEIRRCLKPGGVLLATVPNWFALESVRGLWEPHPREGHHLTRLTVGRWLDLFESAGFRVQREEPLTLLPYVPYFLKPLKRLEEAVLTPALDHYRLGAETKLRSRWPFKRLGLCHAFEFRLP